MPAHRPALHYWPHKTHKVDLNIRDVYWKCFSHKQNTTFCPPWICVWYTTKNSSFPQLSKSSPVQRCIHRSSSSRSCSVKRLVGKPQWHWRPDSAARGSSCIRNTQIQKRKDLRYSNNLNKTARINLSTWQFPFIKGTYNQLFKVFGRLFYPKHIWRNRISTTVRNKALCIMQQNVRAECAEHPRWQKAEWLESLTTQQVNLGKVP